MNRDDEDDLVDRGSDQDDRVDRDSDQQSGVAADERAPTWGELFDRAAAHAVDRDDVRATLARHREDDV